MMDAERRRLLVSGVTAPPVDPNRRATAAEVLAAYGIAPPSKKKGG